MKNNNDTGLFPSPIPLKKGELGSLPMGICRKGASPLTLMGGQDRGSPGIKWRACSDS
jgi:hypothetical protein